MFSTEPFAETMTLLWVRRLELLGANPNPNPTPIRDPPPKPKPASIPNPAIERRPSWAFTSALEGDLEAAVTSTLAVSQDRTLTLTNAQSPWGPNSNV